MAGARLGAEAEGSLLRALGWPQAGYEQRKYVGLAPPEVLYLAFNGRDVSGVSSALLFISVVRTALDDFDSVVPDAIDDAVGVVYPSAPPSREVAS